LNVVVAGCLAYLVIGTFFAEQGRQGCRAEAQEDRSVILARCEGARDHISLAGGDRFVHCASEIAQAGLVGGLERVGTRITRST
jgi:hypothetical protein